MAYRGLILDVDGTLVDSNDGHARAWVAAFRDEGFGVLFEQVRPLIGQGGDQVVPELTSVKVGTPQFDRLVEGWEKHFVAEELGKVKPQPGAKALVEALLARGYQLIVGSSGEDEIVEQLLQLAGVAQLLPNRVHSDEIRASKPEPDIIQVALGKLGLGKEEVLMVGDTPFDIEAARRSGVGTVALRCGGDDRLDGAVAVFDSPADWSSKLDWPPLGTAKG
ncbi:HAD family hydrolase [Deinococcus sp.]|uniref:HAD family hydrolase n=1 Tax=Deinococcus sp. TaxID=47478 RepID=UPI0025C64DE0|nr:HAD family hydrolase [Deinococcus sp.]